ncbi:GNAT family N-acetyltransferase [Alkalihalobacillus sp. AL-G]|uniref:GNAT family N-acetyltransferase n=1 Tax=Alkalihalobacillus sp. AL-G TaxID=2926399 RepID=UPI00272ADDB1|nr:GNAT family N-acetyltransferase [Alkalihalobacillus sp. AL-G]WLD93934.1 GNAT family N-acetyltransferase [Alkalihalobacillus sp. AL-G]
MIEIRKLRPEDAAIYQTLRLEALKNYPEAFASSYEEEVDRDTAFIEKRFRDQNPDNQFIAGAFYGRELVGIAGFFLTLRQKLIHKGEIVSVYVSPHVQRKGVGFKLLQFVIEEARKIESLEQILLTVETENAAAIRSYEKLGFEKRMA